MYLYNNEFRESDHSRDDFGRFTDGKQGTKIEEYKESDLENAVKFTKSPFEITADRKETIKNFKTWYKNNLQGKSVKNPLLGKVFFYGSALIETTHQNIHTIENLKYISVVPEIIKTSKDIVKEDIKHPKPQIKCVYRITGYLEIYKDIKKIEIVVLEGIDGNRFYTFDTRLNKETFNSTLVTAGVLKISMNNTITNNTDFVNNFELNLSITDTDFRVFEINF